MESACLTEAPKINKNAKSKGVQPLFKFCKGFLVIKRKGCGLVTRARLRICDRNKGLLWYLK